ncbi:MAG TPA: ABC transporter permease [Kofleriaceae bacterium]|nr:ABC transporter permease [Kofleriaceae bacterium]
MSSLLRGLVVQGEVVHAVIMRETRTRFGEHRLGYLWALLEPAIVIMTFWGVFVIAKRHVADGFDVFSFVATGLIPYALFGSCANRVAEAINGNKSLLSYPQVLPIDLAIARWLLELATYTAVFIILMGVHALWKRELTIDRPLLVLSGLAMASLLGAALGLVFCGLGQWNNTVDRARGPLLRPLFWISGVFFTAAMLPDHTRAGMLRNPVLHVSEMVRDGWSPQYESPYADPIYVLQWTLFLALTGLVLERWVRRRIEMS